MQTNVRHRPAIMKKQRRHAPCCSSSFTTAPATTVIPATASRHPAAVSSRDTPSFVRGDGGAALTTPTVVGPSRVSRRSARARPPHPAARFPGVWPLLLRFLRTAPRRPLPTLAPVVSTRCRSAPRLQQLSLSLLKLLHSHAQDRRRKLQVKLAPAHRRSDAYERCAVRSTGRCEGAVRGAAWALVGAPRRGAPVNAELENVVGCTQGAAQDGLCGRPPLSVLDDLARSAAS